MLRQLTRFQLPRPKSYESTPVVALLVALGVGVTIVIRTGTWIFIPAVLGGPVSLAVLYLSDGFVTPGVVALSLAIAYVILRIFYWLRPNRVLQVAAILGAVAWIVAGVEAVLFIAYDADLPQT